MDKKYLDCLEHIIKLEETCYTQEKLITLLDKKIQLLAVPKTLTVPQRTHTYVAPVQYSVVRAKKIDGEGIKQISFCCAIISCILGAIIGYNAGSIWGGIFWGSILGAIGGALFGVAMNSSNESEADAANDRAKKAAQEKTDKLIAAQNNIDEQRYQSELKKYHALLLFEQNRMATESNKKNELVFSKEDVIKKHAETKKLLSRFYEHAEIYETYQNIVAMCHIYEYLKSGVCDKLTGRDGAYMVFKYEMYEKLKIERLDTIISKLDQLHFDNITLNNTMEKIGSKCNDLINEVSDLRYAQIEATEQNEALMNNLNKTINSAADRISYQNAVISYNQQCTTSELQQIKWLSVMERR